MRHFDTKDEVSALDAEATGRFDQRRKAMRLMGLSCLMAAFPLLGAETDSPSSQRTGIRALLFDVFGTVVDRRSSIIREGRLLAQQKNCWSIGAILRTAFSTLPVSWGHSVWCGAGRLKRSIPH